MGRRVPNAPRKGGRHSVHYNNYDLRTVKTQTRFFQKLWVMFRLGYVWNAHMRIWRNGHRQPIHHHTLVLHCIAKPPRGAMWKR